MYLGCQNWVSIYIYSIKINASGNAIEVQNSRIDDGSKVSGEEINNPKSS